MYQALGKLYVRELPNGTAKRLTKQEDHLEFFPSFSRDGNRIVAVGPAGKVQVPSGAEVKVLQAARELGMLVVPEGGSCEGVGLLAWVSGGPGCWM